MTPETPKPERPPSAVLSQPHHSWNANHTASNLVTFHLERHSDHHAYAARHYQSLRHFDDVPQLPSGYFGMFLLSYVPFLWRKVMDPRVLALVDGDLGRVNMDPSQITVSEDFRERFRIV